MDDRLIYEILSAVGEIPEGKVATYGQIARLIGRDKNARLVGRALSRAELYGDYPCHRVVNHAGRLAPGWPEQALLLAREGVSLKDGRRVDLARFQWDCLNGIPRVREGGELGRYSLIRIASHAPRCALTRTTRALRKARIPVFSPISGFLWRKGIDILPEIVYNDSVARS